MPKKPKEFLPTWTVKGEFWVVGDAEINLPAEEYGATVKGDMLILGFGDRGKAARKLLEENGFLDMYKGDIVWDGVFLK